MKTPAMKPIRYDLCQVAMIFYFANCLRKENDPPITLSSLELAKHGREYVWNPR
jgi:hypothetical protein